MSMCLRRQALYIYIYMYIPYIGNEKGLKVLGLIGTREKIARGRDPSFFSFFFFEFLNKEGNKWYR